MSAAHPHHHWHWHDFDRTHLRDTVLRLAAAAVFIVAVHAAAVYIAVFWRQAEAGDAAPPAAIMLELAPVAVSEESQVEDTAPGPQMVQAPEPVPDAPDEVEPDAAPPPEPEVVQQVVEKLPEVTPTPEPEKAEVILPKQEPVKEEVKEPPKKREDRPKKEAKRTRKPAAPVTSAAPRSDAPTSQTTAAPSPGAAAVRSAAIADWRSRAMAHINRFKRPQPGHLGTPMVSFSLSGSGSVSGARLARSSGNEVLDREAVAMVQRASPFPAPPDGRGLSITVPINFTTR